MMRYATFSTAQLWRQVWASNLEIPAMDELVKRCAIASHRSGRLYLYAFRDGSALMYDVRTDRTLVVEGRPAATTCQARARLVAEAEKWGAVL